jgi:RNA polymerase sigma factor (sigma-70 family)
LPQQPILSVLPKDGDPKVIAERVYRAYGYAILRYFRARVPNESSEDLTQQTFMYLFEKLKSDPEWVAETKLAAYLFGVARNVASRYYRSHGRLIDSFDERLHDICDFESLGRGPEEALSQMDDAAALARALKLISRSHQLIIYLRIFMDMSISELAAWLGVPGGTAKRRLWEAKRALESAQSKEGVSAKSLSSYAITDWLEEMARNH